MLKCLISQLFHQSSVLYICGVEFANMFFFFNELYNLHGLERESDSIINFNKTMVHMEMSVFEGCKIHLLLIFFFQKIKVFNTLKFVPLKIDA